VRKCKVVAQYQEDIPPVERIVRRFDVEVGCCERCHQRVQGRHPFQTSDALGAAAIQIGPQAVALAAFLNKQLGLSFGKVATLLMERFGLQVTRAALVRALHRVARRAQPSYEALCERIRGSPHVTPDETGWKVAAILWWLHVFVTRDTTVYSIAPGRGYEEAATILGEDYDGTLSRDGWAPYRRFLKADHQTCLGHLLCRCKELIVDHPRAFLPRQVKRLLQDALELRDRHAAKKISDRGLAIGRGKLAERLVRLLEQTSRVPDIERFANHLAKEFAAIFTFLLDPSVDATNWRAEQALRPAVITRKVCGGGNRTARGAQTQQVLASILRTAAQRGLNSSELFVTMLRSPQPVVPPQLQP
jgi:transposase